MPRTILVALLYLLTAGPAEACKCTFYPVAGTYAVQGGPSLSLSYSGGESSCPTQMRLVTSRERANDVDVSLSCAGNGWTGNEKTKVGIFQWSVSGQPDLKGIAKAHRAAYSASVHVGTEVLLTMQPPSGIGGLRTATFTAQLGAKAPACLCRELKADIEFNKKMIRIYQDPKLLRYAAKANLRSTDNSGRVWLDSQNRLQNFKGKAQSRHTYEALVDAEADGRLKWVNGEPKISGATVATTVSASGKPSAAGAGAFIDAGTCRIKLSHADTVANECTFRLELDSYLAHEKQHRKLCDRYNKDLKEVTLQDGRKVYPRGTGPNKEAPYGLGIRLADEQLWTERGVLVNQRYYPAFGDAPENHAKDEIAAYRRGLKTDQDNYRRFCQ